MPFSLARLIRDLFDLREYRLRRRQRLPWRVRIPYLRNRLRHDALARWPGSYVMTTGGRLAYVPSHVDVTAGYRLMKPMLPIELVDTLCRPGDIVLDIGANVGEWTMAMAERVGPNGRVLAFEPVPYLAETISKTAWINRHELVEVHRIALADQDGRAEFSVERGNSGGSRLGRMDGDFSQIAVNVARLDTLLASRADIDRLGFIKIDVEGHEAAVLEGARRTLERFRPPLVIESGFESPEQRSAIHALLTGLDYDIAGAIVPGGLIEVSWPEYAARSGEVGTLGLCNYLILPRRRAPREGL